eukprot:TRINITY_DN3677_c0_g1_i1.p1 TRINITY_DN3677_c0_g1~~TRINITY_DN3677_c0_g1_i1.p1  ORF type:complete len:256 (+),score=87.92 TRINITY_DN3677_c0_g1_i1:69-770(+)
MAAASALLLLSAASPPQGFHVNGTFSGYLETMRGHLAGSASGLWYPPDDVKPPHPNNRTGLRRPRKDNVVWTTGDPQYELPRGFDISPVQSVAIRFSVTQPTEITGLGIWLMKNGGTDGDLPLIHLGIHEGNDITPSAAPAVTTGARCTAEGWVVTQETADLSMPVVAEPGKNYWIVAKSEAPAGFNGVWVLAPLNEEQLEFVALSKPFEPDVWQDHIGYTTTPCAELYGKAM